MAFQVGDKVRWAAARAVYEVLFVLPEEYRSTHQEGKYLIGKAGGSIFANGDSLKHADRYYASGETHNHYFIYKHGGEAPWCASLSKSSFNAAQLDAVLAALNEEA